MPFSIDGNLDGSVNPDIDFFKFTGSPGQTVKVNLQSNTFDPTLGVFDSSCILINSNDDDPAGGTSNSKLTFIIPADGIFVLAATQCCDFGFNIGGNGTYQLTLQPFQTIGSISGRLVNAVTQAALPGFPDPFATVMLQLCDPFCHVVVSEEGVDSAGRFSFTNDSLGQPLEPGDYQVFASATDYLSRQTPVFPVTAGENHDVGDIALQPPVFIGSISGRLVDAVTGRPLSGNIDPFAGVTLTYCGDSGCGFIDQAFSDSDGKFVFTSDFGGQPLRNGTYFIDAFADQYKTTSAQFDVLLDGENRVVGDLSLQSLPIRFTNKVPCKKIPKKGGSCLYSVRVTNGLATLFDGDAWSFVGASGIGSSLDFTQFQPKPTQRVLLQPGESRTVKFDFPLPSTVNDNASICAAAIVGRRPSAIWDTVAETSVFCMTKGTSGFSLMPTKEGHRMFREMESRSTHHQAKPK
ncbi:hypothetical protein [Methyloglobulus sp.]|uniref:hypothetical protein n=1 Tax=Methyloglobulus sp. TaxID=2518622 RepID=UPI0032B8323B